MYNTPLAYVYKIVNTSTKEFYIGSRFANVRFSRTPEQDLFNFYFSSGVLKPQIKETPNNFSYEILFRSNEKVNNEWVVYWYEQLLIKENFGNPLLKNKTYRDVKGKAFYMGCCHNTETKERIKKSLTGRTLSDETKNKISESLIGKKFSEERRTNIRNGLSGRKIQNTENMNKDKIGVPLSEEHKKKLSDGRKGITFSEEHIKNLSESHKGKRLPQTAIDKLCKPCTIDGVKIYPSLKELIKELGKGKGGARSENFRYV